MMPILLALALSPASPPPLEPVPSPRQVAWHKLERYCFVHFGPNTFTGREWGQGTERPEIFDPKKLDCRQWVRTFKRAGFTEVIITAKHHDGFCLWPSKFSTHTIAQSKFRDGKGDILKDLSKACKAEGLKMGVYLSPWDRNHPTYGTPQYNEVFKSMLHEVLTHYGTISEVWFDGANGEGPNGKRQVYDWPAFVKVVRDCQPTAVIFSDGGPDIRWVGNEAGYAGETNWATLFRDKFYPGTPNSGPLTEGQEGGTDWVPAECDVSIRPGWFWRESENSKVKTVAQLLDIYYGSVGRGGTMLLNVPPNSDGLISDEDVTRLNEFNKALEADLSKLLRPNEATADGFFGPGFEAAKAIDGKDDTCWAAPASLRSGTLTLDFGDRRKFDRVMLREPISMGQRVRKFEVRVETDSGWKTVFAGTTIGNKRLLRLPTQESRRVQIAILDARACPLISDVRFYRSPAIDREE